ncbi:hypothetical protein ACFDR9_001234 [Janthinobacterium sp. CG_23.3]|uniref:hypothetical protein n=1 Tax=unclassified Janthinobacterium TaxID=2610881 RepID=UPI000345EDC4|nr:MULTISPECIES: hypothetical protein [unclassified Janthinobacterium]MEC5161981.1 hypothetical protein [Janthinobacterium sp. CG_S6]
MSSEQLTYELTNAQVPFSAIQLELEQAYSSLKEPASDAAQRAVEAGIDTAALPGTFGQVLSVKKSAAGVDSSLVELIIAVSGSGLAATVATDLWKKVLLPILVAKFGVDAIVAKAKPKKESPEQADGDSD